MLETFHIELKWLILELVSIYFIFLTLNIHEIPT